MKSLLQKMQEEGKVFVAKRPSHRNKSIHNSSMLRARSKHPKMTRETFPYVTPSPPRSRQGNIPANGRKEVQRAQQNVLDKRNSHVSADHEVQNMASVNAIEPLFLDPLDELGVGVNLDVYINEQMMQNKQMKKFLKDQEKRTNEIIQSQPSMPSTGTIGHTHSSSSEKGGSSMSSKGSPNPKAMSRSLIHLLAILKQHQANARDALVHITAREKILKTNLKIDNSTYQRLMAESQDSILDAAQTFVELPGLSEQEVNIVLEACHNMLLEAKECDSIKKNIISTLKAIKGQVEIVRDTLHFLSSEEKIQHQIKLTKVTNLCVHALQCKNKSCKIKDCKKMKNNIVHVKTCKIPNALGKECPLCSNMEALLKSIRRSNTGATSTRLNGVLVN